MTTDQLVKEAIAYILACRPSWYAPWWDGPLSDRSPSWAVNAPPPPPSEVNTEGLFCAAVANLMIRKAQTLGSKAKIPNPDNDENWDGGTLAYYKYFYSASEWYKPGANYRDGVLLLSPYKGPGQQGHVAVVCQGYAIESITSGGLVWTYTLEESRAWGKYEIAVAPEVWLGKAEGGEAPQDKEVFNAKTLKAAMSGPWESPDLTQESANFYFPHLLKALKRFEINTKPRLAMFLAQVGHESGGLQWWTEFGGPEKHYAPWYGRGPMQLTWRANYEAFQEASGYEVLADPDLVANDAEVGFASAGWFWRHGNGDLNYFADRDDFDSTCLRVNGGWNGYADRLARYQQALAVLPDNLDLSDAPVDPVTPKEDLVWSRYNLCSAGQPATDFANAAQTALESLSIDTFAMNSPENIGAAAAGAKALNDIGAMNCLIIGQETAEHLPEGVKAEWSATNPVWALFADDDAGTLVRVKNWALPWIATTEGVDTKKLQARFEDILIAIDSTVYGELLAEADDPKQPDPPAPPPPKPDLSLEERVERLEKEVETMKKGEK